MAGECWQGFEFNLKGGKWKWVVSVVGVLEGGELEMANGFVKVRV